MTYFVDDDMRYCCGHCWLSGNARVEDSSFIFSLHLIAKSRGTSPGKLLFFWLRKVVSYTCSSVTDEDSTILSLQEEIFSQSAVVSSDLFYSTYTAFCPRDVSHKFRDILYWSCSGSSRDLTTHQLHSFSFAFL